MPEPLRWSVEASRLRKVRAFWLAYAILSSLALVLLFTYVPSSRPHPSPRATIVLAGPFVLGMGLRVFVRARRYELDDEGITEWRGDAPPRRIAWSELAGWTSYEESGLSGRWRPFWTTDVCFVLRPRRAFRLPRHVFAAPVDAPRLVERLSAAVPHEPGRRWTFGTTLVFVTYLVFLVVVVILDEPA